MNYSILQNVTPALLKTQAQQMMSMCFWKNSPYWSSRSSSITRDSGSVVIRIAYFKTVNWVGFNFCKYHPDAVEVFRKLPKSDRFFYEIKPNRYAAFKVWCVDGQHFEKIISFLKNSPDIEIEFVISDLCQIPELFQPLNLTFYERSVREQGELGRLGELGKKKLLKLQRLEKKKTFETIEVGTETSNFSKTLSPPATPATPAPPALFGGG